LSEILSPSQHPALKLMKKLWEDGLRAKEIAEYLDKEGQTPVKVSALARYGQRNWTGKSTIQVQDKNINELKTMIAELEEEGLRVGKIGMVKRAGWGWEKQDGISIQVPRDTVAQSIEILNNSEVKYERAAIPAFRISSKATGSPSKPVGWKLAVSLPDMQIGYHRGTRGDLTTTHDESAIDVAHQILLYLEENHGVDLIVNQGDNADFPMFSTHRTAPGYLSTTQLTIDRCGTEAAIQRAIATNSENVWIEGNHECRLTNNQVDKVPALVGLARSGEEEPIMSIPYLCKFKESRMTYLDGYPDAEYWANDGLRFVHGHLYSSTKGATANKYLAKGVSTVFGHCFSEDTEILTTDGWKTHDSLSEGSTVMSYNRESGELEWNEVSEVFRYNHHKEMISVKNRDIDILVTPEHGLLTNTCPRLGREWKDDTAESLFGKDKYFMLAGTHDESESEDIDDNMIRLLAWVMTDGSIDKHGYIRISQSDQEDERISNLENVLENLGVSYSKTLRYEAGSTVHGTYRKFNAYRYNLHAGDWMNELYKYIDDEKNPLPALRELSFRQMNIFIESWIDGDGSRNQTQNSVSVQTSSVVKGHMDLIQEFSARTGRRTSLQSYTSPSGTHIWRLTLNPRNTTRVSPDKWTRQEYSGTTWCVTVPNHTLLVRRGGHTAITMNTHRAEVLHANKKTKDGGYGYWAGSAGCLCKTEGAVPSASTGIKANGRQNSKAKTEDWQQGIFVIWYEDGGTESRVEPVLIQDGKAIFRGIEFTATVNPNGEPLNAT